VDFAKKGTERTDQRRRQPESHEGEVGVRGGVKDGETAVTALVGGNRHPNHRVYTRRGSLTNVAELSMLNRKIKEVVFPVTSEKEEGRPR